MKPYRVRHTRHMHRTRCPRKMASGKTCQHFTGGPKACTILWKDYPGTSRGSILFGSSFLECFQGPLEIPKEARHGSADAEHRITKPTDTATHSKGPRLPRLSVPLPSHRVCALYFGHEGPKRSISLTSSRHIPLSLADTSRPRCSLFAPPNQLHNCTLRQKTTAPGVISFYLLWFHTIMMGALTQKTAL
jgi:hypothetical protein